MNNNELEILMYEPSLKPFFKSLNYEWLNKYFFVTDEDDKQLSNPERIINEGGCVIFAKLDDEIIGTCALIKKSDSEYEIGKMAVTEKAQGKKIGQKLIDTIINEARRRKAKLVSLETASVLKSAISLYQKTGFSKATGERIHSHFGRKTFRMELELK